MKVKTRTTLALSVALMFGAATAYAADDLDITIQVLDMNSSDPVNQLDLPDMSGQDVSVGDAVSQAAHGLKANHESAESGRDFADSVHDTLVSVASENKDAHADVTDDAADATADATQDVQDTTDSVSSQDPVPTTSISLALP